MQKVFFLKKTFLSFFVFLFAFSCIFSFNPAAAQGLKDSFNTEENSHLDTVAKKAGIDTDNPENKFNKIIATLINVVLSLLGIIFLILMIYGGFLWMTARGNESQVTKARDLITAAIIGLIIVLGAYAITHFVISKVGAGTLS